MTDSSATEKIVVTSIKVKTPIADELELNAAALRAGISAYEEFQGYYPLTANVDDESSPCLAAFDSQIEEQGWERLVHLIEKTFLLFVAETGYSRKQFERGAIWFALPESDKVVQGFGLQEKLLPHLINRFALPSGCEFRSVQQGVSGVAQLMSEAQQALSENQFDFVIIVAIDSWMLDGRINLYDQQWRIKSDRNPTGFVPGEGAGLMLLETQTAAKARNQTPLLEVLGASVVQEANPITDDKSSSGVGLSQAIETAVAGGINNPIKYLFSDLNGEGYRAFEWAVVHARLARLFDQNLTHVYPAETFGNLGAVGLVMSLGCFSESLEKKYAPDSNALLIVGNDAGQRAALYVNQTVGHL